jgi:hypothetical protein
MLVERWAAEQDVSSAVSSEIIITFRPDRRWPWRREGRERQRHDPAMRRQPRKSATCFSSRVSIWAVAWDGADKDRRRETLQNVVGCVSRIQPGSNPDLRKVCRDPGGIPRDPDPSAYIRDPARILTNIPHGSPAHPLYIPDRAFFVFFVA